MDLEKIRTICFLVGITCGIIGFLMARIYFIAFVLLVIGIGIIYSEYSNNKAIELIIQKDKG